MRVIKEDSYLSDMSLSIVPLFIRRTTRFPLEFPIGASVVLVASRRAAVFSRC